MPASTTRKKFSLPVKQDPGRKTKSLPAGGNGKRTAFPKSMAPMLATLTDKPFDDAEWIYEIKWDGYRAIAMCQGGNVQLISRNNKSFNDKFYPIYEEVAAWGLHAVVDGEIVVLNKKGVSHFGSLQNWRSEADGELIYYVFDLLWLNGYDITMLPLTQRRELLQSLVPSKGPIRMSENFKTSATEFLTAAAGMGMEGIIAKKASGLYYPGERTREWLKIKTHKRHEVVIGGFTRNEGSDKAFSSLLVGVYAHGKLQYTGKIGTGFSNKLQQQLMELFAPLITVKMPFDVLPDINKPSRFRPNPPKAVATWLKPRLVCEVSYAEITDDNVMRHPSFEGMREDKTAKDVVMETAADINGEVMPLKKKARPEKKKNAPEKLLRPGSTGIRKTLLNPTDETQVRSVGGHEIRFSNLSKIFWPLGKYTKRDMLNYYYQAAPYIMPYLKDRPQSMNRFPNGIDGKSFYQKDITGKAPDWIRTFPYHTSDGEDKNFLVPSGEADLLFMANQGCIEMNPWNSRIQQPDYPDWCALDLDPDKENSFEQVIQTALEVKKVLDEMNVTGYCKTSGSTGIHIYIPLAAKYDYDSCQLFGKWIATQVQLRLPGFTSIERMTKNRKGKLYIDYLQNRPKATLAAPYSLRPKPDATVSMPLHWDEVKKGLQLKHFTIKNAAERVKAEGDLFKPVLGKGINLRKILASL